jgi:hypothetical protein
MGRKRAAFREGISEAERLDELGAAGRVDFRWVSVDSFSLRALKGGT